MSKIKFFHGVLIAATLFITTITLQFCKDDKKQTTVLVQLADTTKIIDTVIEEPGIAQVAEDNAIAKGKDKPEKQKKIKISCSFGQQKFNNRKRPIAEAPGGQKGKPPKPGGGGGNPPPDPQPPVGTKVIYINFFGKTVSGTMWNTNGTFTVQDAGLAQSEMDYIKSQVTLHYTNYNVVVTYDVAVFNAAPEGSKIEVIVTEDWQWYGQAGGVAYINSFFWTTPEPAFVFSTLLNYNGHNIAEAVAHEAGHTLGLRHQSDCVDGVNMNEYRMGWMMGNSYYVPLGIQGTGTNSLCATQDDIAKLVAGLGIK